MTGDCIPDKDHVVRNCSATRIAENGRPLADAFKLRPTETYLSVDWLEFHNKSDSSEQLDAVRDAFARRRITLKKHARLAELNVGRTKDRVRGGTLDKREVDFKHQPRDVGDSHSGIFNTNHDDKRLVVASLVAKSVTNMHPATAS